MNDATDRKERRDRPYGRVHNAGEEKEGARRTLICGCVQTRSFGYATSRSEPFPSSGSFGSAAEKSGSAPSIRLLRSSFPQYE